MGCLATLRSLDRAQAKPRQKPVMPAFTAWTPLRLDGYARVRIAATPSSMTNCALFSTTLAR